MTGVLLPEELRSAILEEARARHPRECCGLLEGVRQGADFRVTRLYPVRNLATAPDRFEMDPQDQFAAHKSARARGHTVIGCYHSHPDGRARPSQRDLAGAGEENFLWVIAARETLAAFVYSCGEFVGADWVTSSE
ncbi:MAG TPA: M67 family metallopeptidase [Rhizomicrobium sp.]|nr:M67 family metallopeptidase [Rhizomicrobium sp.]